MRGVKDSRSPIANSQRNQPYATGIPTGIPTGNRPRSRFTFHVSRTRFHAPGFTHQVSRTAFLAPRFTHPSSQHFAPQLPVLEQDLAQQPNGRTTVPQHFVMESLQ